jgi:quinol monooxygenase YgiN
MRGRKRRDDGWDEGRRDRKDDRRDGWADVAPEDWGDRGRGDGSQAGFSGGDYGDPGFGGAGSAGAGPGYGGSGFTGRDYPGGGQAGAGYPAAGYAGAGLDAPGYDSSGYNGPGYNGSGSGAPGYDRPGYGGRAGDAAGYGGGPGGESAYGDRGQAGGGYQDPGYAQGGYGGAAGYGGGAGYNGAGYNGYNGAGHNGAGYNGAGYDGAANGGTPAPSFHPVARNGTDRRLNGAFSDSPSPAQYGRSPSVQDPARGTPEFTALDTAAANGSPSGASRPYGRLCIFTLLDDKVAEFDRLAELAAEGVRTAEPDTLVYVIHVVPKAPMQRIIYEIYRDRAAFETHERQPHIQQFVADRRSCVLATNMIDLRLKYAKVGALGTAQAPQAMAQAPQAMAQAPQAMGQVPPMPQSSHEPQATWTPHAVERADGQYSAYPGYPAADGDRRAAGAGGYQPTADQYRQYGRYPGNGRPPELNSGRQLEAGDQYTGSGAGYPGYSGYPGYAEGGQFPAAAQDRYPDSDDRSPRSQSPDWSESRYGGR